jgi:anti-sigma factor RsiW
MMNKRFGDKPASSTAKSKFKIRTKIATCKDEIALIGDYLSSELSPPLLVAFKSHLEICPDCAAFFETYKKTIEATRALLTEQSREDLLRKLVLRPPKNLQQRQIRSLRIELQ